LRNLKNNMLKNDNCHYLGREFNLYIMKKHLFFLGLLLSGTSAFSQSSESVLNATFSNTEPEYSVNNVFEGNIYSNGPYYNQPGSPNVSLLENSTLGMTTLGFGASNASGYLVADDFVLTETVSIDNFQFYTYQTGSTTTSTINFISVIIYDGEPGAGGNIIYGDEFENFYASSEFSGTYRRSETSSTDTTRPIMIVTAETPDLILGPGTYWVAFNFGGTLSSGPWAPPISILGEMYTGNGLQYDPNTATWNIAEDGGAFQQQGFPFEINGEVLSSVNDLSANSFSIYPNPATTILNVSSKSKVQEVSIYSLTGQEVMKATPNSSNSQINVSALSKGTYLVKAIVDGKTQTSKFVKK
jgi:hypothetical protein